MCSCRHTGCSYLSCVSQTSHFLQRTNFLQKNSAQFNLVPWCHYVPRAGDTGWVVLFRPVGCFKSPSGLVQPAATVLVPCGVTSEVTSGLGLHSESAKYETDMRCGDMKGCQSGMFFDRCERTCHCTQSLISPARLVA